MRERRARALASGACEIKRIKDPPRVCDVKVFESPYDVLYLYRYYGLYDVISSLYELGGRLCWLIF